LEYPRGWMDTVSRLAPDTGFDRIGQVERTFERPPRPPLLDHASNPPGMALFAEQAEDAGEIAALEGVDHLGRAKASLRHAHVKRPVGTEGETAAGLVELHGRHANVQDHAINGFGM